MDINKLREVQSTDKDKKVEAQKLFPNALDMLPFPSALDLMPSGAINAVKGLRTPPPFFPKHMPDPNLASEFHKRLIKWINDFNDSLDETFEVGIKLVSFGQTVVFHLSDIGYWNPSLISFSGVTEDGQPVELIQHVSQISILLMKMKRANPSEPKRKIGFHPEVEYAAETCEQENEVKE